MLDKLKQKGNLNRNDISEVLKSIGKPGKKRQEKIEAIRVLNKKNFQGINLVDTLEDFPEY